MNKITLLLVDDHKLIRETWDFIFKADPNFQVVGACASGEEAVELSGSLRPDIVIMDINLPGMSGMDAVPMIRKFSPASRILVVSLHNQPDFARQMVSKGAMGYVTKNSNCEELFHALKEIWAGRKYICREIKNILSEQVLIASQGSKAKKISLLSQRELQIIGYIKKGFSSREIAEQLNLAPKTVDVHRYNILKKLKLKNTAELVDFINKHDLGME